MTRLPLLLVLLIVTAAGINTSISAAEQTPSRAQGSIEITEPRQADISTMPRTVDSNGSGSDTQRSGDPIPGIDITVNQSPHCNCGDANCVCAPPPPPPGIGTGEPVSSSSNNQAAPSVRQ